MNENHDVIIIGGGVSGLVFAEHAARAGLSTVLLERDAALGGCIASWEALPGFHVELGAHTAYNSYGALLRILERRGRLGELLRREKLGYRFLDGAALQSPLARLNWPSLLASLPFGLFQDKRDKSVRDYFGALLGADNYTRVLGPAFAAVLSQPCDTFPAQWLFRRKPRLKSAPRKYTWRSGLQGLLNALVEGAAFGVRLDTEVLAVTRAGDGYVVHAGNRHLACRWLAVATPPDVAARLLTGAAPEVAGLLGEFPMADIESMAAVIGRAKSPLPPLAGLIGVDDAFYSAVSRDPVPHPTLRGFTFHFRPGRLDEAAKRRRMVEVLGCADSDLIDTSRRVNRLPSLDTRHPALAARLDSLLAGGRLALLGNYFQGMSIGDCAERAEREAARLFGQGANA
jgi:protoporphyrinogen oxidase